MVPDLFHVVPVGDDAMFDGIVERQNTPFGLGFISRKYRLSIVRVSLNEMQYPT
jgi:hypothetical protein